MEAVKEKEIIRGGEFLVKVTDFNDVFTPEEWTEEQRTIAKMCTDFVDQEVMPNIEKLDSMTDPTLMPTLLTKAGELGLLGITVPEEYSGFGQGTLTGMLTNEILGAAHSFSVAILAHCGIGSLPLLYFGTKEQKEKYLHKLATGEWKASYCLTEPGSGSDALGAKTKAVMNAEGTHYVLNGQKMWITNAGFADLFTVFAKIDGDKFTGFLIERDTPGLTFGEEEKKMGIKGSSTRQVFLMDVKVPKENVLGEIGKGHLIAFNILNIGRIKLSAAATGSSKKVVAQAVKYANERIQFNKPISSFGAIQTMIADMAIATYTCETATYRCTYDIEAYEHKLMSEGQPFEKGLLGAASEFAAECAIMKVFGSEVLDLVVDYGVQIYGGNGFSAEYPMDRAYRDSRINRIYEGTNEINLMLTVDYILKKALKGELNIMGPAYAVQKELTSMPDFSSDDDSSAFAAEKKVLANLKKAFLMTAGAAVKKQMDGQLNLQEEQEILMSIARMVMDIYVAESAILRVEKRIAVLGAGALAVQADIARVFIHEAADRFVTYGKPVINALYNGDELRVLLMGLKRFTKTEPFDSIAAKRRIAAHLIEANDYNI
jgi:alkylation response protein AidB-like acyl-CoA dehydrogenase